MSSMLAYKALTMLAHQRELRLFVRPVLRLDPRLARLLTSRPVSQAARQHAATVARRLGGAVMVTAAIVLSAATTLYALD